MGVSIHGDRIAVKDIISQVEAKSPDLTDKMPVAELLELILPHFGVVDFGVFYTVYNEYYDEYNPGAGFDEFINRYYDLGEDFYITGMESFGHGANAYEVASALGIELSYDDDEDDY